MAERRLTRYETLDAWRGLACVAVIAFHTVAVALARPEFLERVATEGGSFADWLVIAAVRLWVGVPVFFVISGYCIAAAAENSRHRPRPWVRFLKRRVRRIYPPLWIFLAIGAVTLPLLQSVSTLAIPFKKPTDITPWQWVGSLTLTEEWRPHFFGPSTTDYFIGHIWTLCYEEQFYLVVGLILAFASKRLYEVIAVITLLVTLKLLDLIALPFSTSGFFFEGLWLAFAAGVGVYYRAHRASSSGRMCIDAALLIGTIWAISRITDRWHFPQTIPANLAVAFPTAALLGWLYRWDAITAKWWILAPLRWCGTRCYSLYLVHGPITCSLSLSLFQAGVTSSLATLLFTFPACLALSLLFAWGFHRWVESRFLNSSAPVQAAREPARSGASATVTSLVRCPVES